MPVARRGGPQPDEVVIRIRGSKNDQLNVGEVRNHHAYGGDLCVVSALARLRNHFPARFDGGPEARSWFSADAIHYPSPYLYGATGIPIAGDTPDQSVLIDIDVNVDECSNICLF